MKRISKIIILTGLAIAASQYKAAAAGTLTKGDRDTTGLKSNIVIFKIMASPAPATPAQSKSLKKAGSVARTSNNVHTSSVNSKTVPAEG